MARNKMKTNSKLVYRSDLKSNKWYWIPFIPFATVIIISIIIIAILMYVNTKFIVLIGLPFIIIALILSYHRMIEGLQNNIEIWNDKIVTISRRAFPPWKFNRFETLVNEINSYDIEDEIVFFHYNNKYKKHFNIKKRTPEKKDTLNEIDKALKKIGLKFIKMEY